MKDEYEGEAYRCNTDVEAATETALMTTDYESEVERERARDSKERAILELSLSKREPEV